VFIIYIYIYLFITLQAKSVIEKAQIGAGTIAVTGITLALHHFVPKEIKEILDVLDGAATIVQSLDILLEDRTRKRERRTLILT
jgi:hypothetical protein